jgi:hypothetical protein
VDISQMKPHQMGLMEFSTPDNPSTKYRMLCDWTLKLNGRLFNGEPATLRISLGELPRDENYVSRLNPMQTTCLWLVTEGTIFPSLNGLPGWRLAQLLEMRPNNLSRDMISPLEKMKLIYHERRATTKPGSSHPNKRENVYYLKRINMRSAFNILFQCFEKRYHNHIIWEGAPKKEPTWINFIAGMRFSALALLQKKLDEYENSAQYYVDRGVNPPPTVRNKA